MEEEACQLVEQALMTGESRDVYPKEEGPPEEVEQLLPDSNLSMICRNCAHYFGLYTLGWCHPYQCWVRGSYNCSAWELRGGSTMSGACIHSNSDPATQHCYHTVQGVFEKWLTFPGCEAECEGTECLAGSSDDGDGDVLDCDSNSGIENEIEPLSEEGQELVSDMLLGLRRQIRQHATAKEAVESITREGDILIVQLYGKKFIIVTQEIREDS